MATTNSRMAQRIDTLANWTSNNPLIEPGETCYIEGSTDYRVNTGNTAVNFLNCQLFKGSDTASAAPGDGTTTLLRYGGSTIGSWSANQGSANSVTLPNFVANAKIEFPSTDVKQLVENNWRREDVGQQLPKQIPNCAPVDYMVVVFREFAARLDTLLGTQTILPAAQEAVSKSLELCNIKN